MRWGHGPPTGTYCSIKMKAPRYSGSTRSVLRPVTCAATISKSPLSAATMAVRTACTSRRSMKRSASPAAMPTSSNTMPSAVCRSFGFGLRRPFTSGPRLCSAVFRRIARSRFARFCRAARPVIILFRLYTSKSKAGFDIEAPVDGNARGQGQGPRVEQVQNGHAALAQNVHEAGRGAAARARARGQAGRPDVVTVAQAGVAAAGVDEQRGEGPPAGLGQHLYAELHRFVQVLGFQQRPRVPGRGGPQRRDALARLV